MWDGGVAGGEKPIIFRQMLLNTRQEEFEGEDLLQSEEALKGDQEKS